MSASPPLFVGSGATVLTMLLGDVEASTILWEHSEAEMPTALATLNEVIDRTVGAAGGARPLEQGEGDSFVAAFGQARDAVAAAVDLQLALADRPLHVRLAIHTGDVLHRDDGTYMGSTLNRAARLRDLGHGGQVLLSQSTYDLVDCSLPEGVSVIDCGVHRLRDVSRAEHVYQLVHPGLRRGFPPLRSAEPVAGNLPAEVSSFIGRHQEMDEVASLLAEARVVTLTGSGGCGKTRLALQVAASLCTSYSGGVWFVDLAAVRDQDAVAAAVAATLSLRDLPGLSSVDVVARHLRRSVALLLLDNCEQIIAGAATFTDAVTRLCPDVTILSTSREPLGAAGEIVWRVPSLGLPPGPAASVTDLAGFDAIRLFIDRATAARPNFVMNADIAAAVAAVCTRLDGIPLAIELAAARVRVLSIEQIKSGLRDRFRLLGSGNRAAMPRQQTLSASVGWSHDLLTAEQQTLFRRLCVFVGPFDLDAAETVGGSEPLTTSGVFELLAQLVDRSLVLMDSSTGTARYRLLETIRHYGMDHLLAHAEAVETRDRHLAHHRDVVVRSTGASESDIDAFEAVDRIHGDITAALDWALTSGHIRDGMMIVGALELYWMTRGRFVEGRRWAEELEAAGGDSVDPATRASNLLVLDWMAEFQGDMPTAANAADQALGLARETADARLQARALTRVGFPRTLFDYESGIALLHDAEALARAEDDTRALLQVLLFLGFFGHIHDGSPNASDRLLEAVATANRGGHTLGSLPPRVTLAGCALRAGDLATAIPELADLEARLEAADYPYWLSVTRSQLAFGDLLRGRPDSAVRRCHAALADTAPTGVPFIDLYTQTILASSLMQLDQLEDAHRIARNVATDSASLGPWLGAQYRIEALTVLVAVAIHDHDLTEASRLATETLELTAARPGPIGTGLARLTGARVAQLTAEPRHAEQLAQEALDTFIGANLTVYVPEVLDLLAVLDLDRGDQLNAARLAGAATALRTRLTTTSLRLAVDDHQLAPLTAVRETDSNIAGAWQSGQTLTIEELTARIKRGHGTRRRPTHGWSSMTPTEMSVITLIAEGLTNADIAARLFMSRRTVSTHLTHVFTKLGVSTRAELAAAAARRGF